MAFDRRELGVIALVALGAVLFLVSVIGFLSAGTNLVLRLAALVLAFGAVIYLFILRSRRG
jgi:hypothetical protein